MICTPPTKIYVKEIDGKGLGVFCNSEIIKDEIIEVCPVYKIDNNDNYLKDYRFLYPRKRGNHYGIAWGYGSLYNHSNKPNCDWRDGTNGCFEFFAVRKINKDEEICINYGGTQYWGERSHVKVI